MTKDKSYILASSHFLYEELPTNWQDLSETEIDEYIEEYKCEFMQNYPAHYVWENLETLAMDFMSVFKSK